jgi:hypothetical protein
VARVFGVRVLFEAGSDVELKEPFELFLVALFLFADEIY